MQKERKRYTYLKEQYVVTGTLSEAILDGIVRADPTTLPGDSPKIGKFVNWMIHNYCKAKNKDSFISHLPQTTVDLAKFERYREVLTFSDINKYRSLQELNKVVRRYPDEDRLHKRERREFILKNYTKTVYEDEQCDVVIPMNVQAARELGGPPLTNWCTNEPRYFKRYNRMEPLYIIRDKGRPVNWGQFTVLQPVAQLYFRDLLFCNEIDEQFNIFEFFKEHPRLAGFFKEKLRKSVFRHDTNEYIALYNNYFSVYGFTKQEEKTFLLKIRKTNSKATRFTLNLSSITHLADHYGTTQFLSMFCENLPPTLKAATIFGDGNSTIELPEKLLNQPELEELNVTGCLNFFPDVSKLKKLSVLSLGQNKIRSISPSVYRLRHLKAVNLTMNPLETEIKARKFFILK